MKTEKITWSASNNSTFLNGSRPAKSIRDAVRQARAYLRGELMGEGEISIYEDGKIVRCDEYSIFTGYKWNIRIF